MKEIKYPRSFSHIGITVPDIEKAVEFYSEVMGWYVVANLKIALPVLKQY